FADAARDGNPRLPCSDLPTSDGDLRSRPAPHRGMSVQGAGTGTQRCARHRSARRGCAQHQGSPMTTVVVLDYGSGNIRSAERAVARAGAEVMVTTDAELAASADGLVVPGVGAFAACMAGLVFVGGHSNISPSVA